MAELIGGDVGGVIGFDSVSSTTTTDGDFSLNNKGEEQGCVVSEVLYGDSSQFQVVLKQLGKRDTITKLKVSSCRLKCRGE